MVLVGELHEKCETANLQNELEKKENSKRPLFGTELNGMTLIGRFGGEFIVTRFVIF